MITCNLYTYKIDSQSHSLQVLSIKSLYRGKVHLNLGNRHLCMYKSVAAKPKPKHISIPKTRINQVFVTIDLYNRNLAHTKPLYRLTVSQTLIFDAQFIGTVQLHGRDHSYLCSDVWICPNEKLSSSVRCH